KRPTTSVPRTQKKR
ncbi:unnamed protein product, partial [Rotaria sp. Silwood2]